MPRAITYRRFSIGTLEREIKDAFLPTSAQITRLIVRASGADGTLSGLTRRQRAVLVDAVGDAVLALFVGADGKNAFAPDGVTALAAYPRVLNRWIVKLSYEAVKPHSDYLQRVMPDDLKARIQNAQRHVREAENPYLLQPGESREAHIARLKALRLFDPNPLAEYDPAHTWVDPNGYTLSRRIWRVGFDTRSRMERLLTDLIAQGKSATEIARQLEQFLIPGRSRFRTKRPYGSDASFDAMRLARTEIARAANAAALAAARMNPYVDTVDWARSANGDPTCPVCAAHETIGISQTRVRDPYPKYDAPTPPGHPHCMCRIQSNVSLTPDEITAQLRDMLDGARQEYLLPYLTPLEIEAFLRQLLGDILVNLLAQTLQMPLI